jgi:hypothetical protein
VKGDWQAGDDPSGASEGVSMNAVRSMEEKKMKKRRKKKRKEKERV